MDGWMNGWMNGWMDGWMDGWNGCMGRKISEWDIDTAIVI